jgi:hypothetical protein
MQLFQPYVFSLIYQRNDCARTAIKIKTSSSHIKSTVHVTNQTTNPHSMKLHTNYINTSKTYMSKKIIVLMFLSLVHPGRMQESVFEMSGTTCIWVVRFYQVVKYHFFLFQYSTHDKQTCCVTHHESCVQVVF